MTQPLGAILSILTIWLYACDRGNEFVPWIGGVGIVCLLIPVAYAAFLRY